MFRKTQSRYFYYSPISVPRFLFLLHVRHLFLRPVNRSDIVIGSQNGLFSFPNLPFTQVSKFGVDKSVRLRTTQLSRIRPVTNYSRVNRELYSPSTPTDLIFNQDPRTCTRFSSSMFFVFVFDIILFHSQESNDGCGETFVFFFFFNLFLFFFFPFLLLFRLFLFFFTCYLKLRAFTV